VLLKKETLLIGKSLLILEETDSTNAFLQRIIKDIPTEGTVVWAKNQYAGRGQAHNVWESESNKNLTFSVLLYPKFLNLSHLFYLNKIVALAIFKALKNYLSHEKIEIKWPNDILINKKKICGILIENNLDQRLNASILGIGININQTQFSPWIDFKTTSLKKITQKDYDLHEVLSEINYWLEYYYLALKSHFFDSIDREYLQNLFGYQEENKFKIQEKEFIGSIIGVHKDGRLAVHHDGSVKNYYFKEIEYVL
jgi:BirA family biotin operon repressor/biotin-[acetyl-CoA-carboxylase] ligase